MKTDDAAMEREITDQVVALRARLNATVKKRRELEGRIRHLRAKLRAEEARLGSEQEREEALKTALQMAELALNLASGETPQQEVPSLETVEAMAEAPDWHDLTIAQACQRALQAHQNQPMTNRELQATLQAHGKDVPLGSIATTLERYRDRFRKDKRGNVIYWSLRSEVTSSYDAEASAAEN